MANRIDRLIVYDTMVFVGSRERCQISTAKIRSRSGGAEIDASWKEEVVKAGVKARF